MFLNIVLCYTNRCEVLNLSHNLFRKKLFIIKHRQLSEIELYFSLEDILCLFLLEKLLVKFDPVITVHLVYTSINGDDLEQINSPAWADL